MTEPLHPLSWPLPSADIVGDLPDGTQLRLRAAVKADIPGMVISCRDASTREFTHMPENYTAADAEGFLRAMMHSPTTMLWILDNPDEPGTFGGTLEVRLVDRSAYCVELGYTTAPHLRGRGLMSAVVAAVTEFLFDYRVHRVQLKANPVNVASCRVAERAGFTREGTLRDAELLHGRFNDLAIYSRVMTD